MAITHVPITITVTVAVYEKNGLKRGPGIGSATFSQAPPVPVPDDTSSFSWTGGGPLGAPPVYQVRIRFMRRVSDPDPWFHLVVGSGRQHGVEIFWVRNGMVFESRLQRR